MRGEIMVNGSDRVGSPCVVVFEQADVEFELNAQTDSKFLILTGEPLNEPIEGYGPFVMNNKQEIVEAIHDFNHGKFGQLHPDA